MANITPKKADIRTKITPKTLSKEDMHKIQRKLALAILLRNPIFILFLCKMIVGDVMKIPIAAINTTAVNSRTATTGVRQSKTRNTRKRRKLVMIEMLRIRRKILNVNLRYFAIFRL